MKRFLLLTLILAATMTAFAYTGTTIGPDVSELDGKKLQWEAGSFDYFVMFKSLMGNDIRDICTDANSPAGCDWSDNPEPDSCLQQSTFKLTNTFRKMHTSKRHILSGLRVLIRTIICIPTTRRHSTSRRTTVRSLRL